jgi:anti-sigma factor RsiW
MPETPVWLERELSDGLGRVAAPADLWERVEAPPAQGRSVPWALAAMLMIGVAVGTLWSFMATRNPVVEAARAAMRSPSATPALDLQTGSCAELQDWLRRQAGLEVAIPGNQKRVELLGARMIRRGGDDIAAIAYRFANGAATLFVGKAKAGGEGKHGVTHVASIGGAELYSWTSHEQSFALVSASHEDPRGACRLCHDR